MAQQMASMLPQPRLAHGSLISGGSHKVSFASPRALNVRSTRQAAPRVMSAASSGARSSQGDPTFELMAAEKRWEESIREGRVKSISAKAAGDLKQDGWVFLDVRPPPETAKAAVDGAVEVPIYIPESQWSPINVLKQLSNFGLGGWWLGGSHMIPNEAFMQEVRSKVPQDSKVIVACQKGLRSLSAAEQLSKAGYGTIAWINGGLDTSKKTDLPVKGADDLRYGGIGGMSEALGWTNVQREKSAGFMGGSFGPIKVAIGVLALDGAWAAYDFIQEQIHKGAPGP